MKQIVRYAVTKAVSLFSLPMNPSPQPSPRPTGRGRRPGNWGFKYLMLKLHRRILFPSDAERLGLPSDVFLTEEGVRGTLLRLLSMHIILLGAILACAALGQNRALDSTNAYHVTAKRNAFALKNGVITARPRLSIEPQEDLLLTGLSEIAGKRQAFFVLMEPGKQPSSFMMREGEENEWIELKAVNVKERTVRALLKKPFARCRNVGEEVVLTIQSAGTKCGTFGNNRGNPHVENSSDP
jgi:hypothetical protein